MSLLISWIVTSLAFLITAYIVPGFTILDFRTALLLAIVWGIVQFFVKPILTILTLPLTILTLGLFYFVINAILLMMAAAFVPGVKVDSLFTAIIASLVLSVVNMILQKLVR